VDMLCLSRRWYVNSNVSIILSFYNLKTEWKF
jgi:hypothetical protein